MLDNGNEADNVQKVSLFLNVKLDHDQCHDCKLHTGRNFVHFVSAGEISDWDSSFFLLNYLKLHCSFFCKIIFCLENNLCVFLPFCFLFLVVNWLTYLCCAIRRAHASCSIKANLFIKIDIFEGIFLFYTGNVCIMYIWQYCELNVDFPHQCLAWNIFRQIKKFSLISHGYSKSVFCVRCMAILIGFESCIQCECIKGVKSLFMHLIYRVLLWDK